MVSHCRNIASHDYRQPTHCLQLLAPSWKFEHKQTERQTSNMQMKNRPQVWKSSELSHGWRRSPFNLQPLVWHGVFWELVLKWRWWLQCDWQTGIRGKLRQSRTIICGEAAVRGVHDGLREHPGGTSRLKVRLRSCRQAGRDKGFAQSDELPKKWEEYCADTAFTRTPVSGYDFAIYSVKCEGTNEESPKDYYSWKKIRNPKWGIFPLGLIKYLEKKKKSTAWV